MEFLPGFELMGGFSGTYGRNRRFRRQEYFKNTDLNLLAALMASMAPLVY
jgi:hypothetical protein